MVHGSATFLLSQNSLFGPQLNIRLCLVSPRTPIKMWDLGETASTRRSRSWAWVATATSIYLDKVVLGKAIFLLERDHGQALGSRSGFVGVSALVFDGLTLASWTWAFCTSGASALLPAFGLAARDAD